MVFNFYPKPKGRLGIRNMVTFGLLLTDSKTLAEAEHLFGCVGCTCAITQTCPVRMGTVNAMPCVDRVPCIKNMLRILSKTDNRLTYMF